MCFNWNLPVGPSLAAAEADDDMDLEDEEEMEVCGVELNMVLCSSTIAIVVLQSSRREGLRKQLMKTGGHLNVTFRRHKAT